MLSLMLNVGIHAHRLATMRSDWLNNAEVLKKCFLKRTFGDDAGNRRAQFMFELTTFCGLTFFCLITFSGHGFIDICTVKMSENLATKTQNKQAFKKDIRWMLFNNV